MRTCDCGRTLPQTIARCPTCGRAFSHRDCFPDQYAHPLVGRPVRVRTRKGHETTGTVERVVSTRFGRLAHLEGDDTTAWLLADCTPLPAPNHDGTEHPYPGTPR